MDSPLPCDPRVQQARQDDLDALYAADGRHDPAHPLRSLYTGLVAPLPQNTCTTTPEP